MSSSDNKRILGMLPWPSSNANKYSRGKVALIVGSDRYPGAACLATRAALRMGAGYAEMFSASHLARQLILQSCPSAVARALDEFDVNRFSDAKPGHPQAICIGPGFDACDDRYAEVLVDTLKHAVCPVLVDGGALSLLGGKRAKKALAKRAERGYATVLTPHAGEAGRLAKSFDVDAADEAQLALALATAAGAIIVHKGPDTYIADEHSVSAMREGTPALAKAGTGDVLAGMISALLAQGLDATEAAWLGATIHARAGVAASQENTVICTMAEDVIDFIPQAIKSLKDD